MRDEHTEYSCAAALAIEVLQGKWRIQILCVMREGPVRLGQLGRRIPSASKKVLTENLRNLESAGLIVRTDMSRQVRHLEYDLAEASKSGSPGEMGRAFMIFRSGSLPTVRCGPKQVYFCELQRPR
jgi:DNA-binding HxlR family transcriptional regulator